MNYPRFFSGSSLPCLTIIYLGNYLQQDILAEYQAKCLSFAWICMNNWYYYNWNYYNANHLFYLCNYFVADETVTLFCDFW